MRPLADEQRINAFLRAIGRMAKTDARLYLTGGATAVLEGWRGSTVDVDLRFEPDADDILRALPELKERIDINIEDVWAMLGRRLVEADQALRLFEAIEPELYRYPAIDPASFRRRVEQAFSSHQKVVRSSPASSTI